MKKYLTLTALLIMVCASSISQAANSWTGTLTTGSGALTSGPTGDKLWGGRGISITWLVTQTVSGYFYSYELNVAPGISPMNGISHMIFECSDNFTDAGVIDTYSATSQGASNVGIPASIYGTKFNKDTLGVTTNTATNWTVSFSSTHAPVWGDFYAKGGQSSFVYNTAFDSAFNATAYIWQTAVGTGNYLSRIAVPDHVKAVPEASTLAGFGSSLMIAAPGLIRWIRRRRA